MFKIKAPTNFTGEGWGLNFVKGEAKTDNATLAKKLQSKGYKVEVAEESDDSLKFICPVCGREYKSEAALNKHIAKEHPEDNAPEDDETPEDDA
ncbi:MAG: C2H2-type zinc finger protein [Clostridia bacterium]|nr:C2H2-type zinc finger protein [Clostridia bacterium]